FRKEKGRGHKTWEAREDPDPLLLSNDFNWKIVSGIRWNQQFQFVLSCFFSLHQKDWMNVPITFPPISTDDVSDGPLIVEAEDIKSRLTPTQTELVGFSGEQLVPIGKIELEVQFG
ncbi:hypothetical protein Tco_1469605, partial [Tanacetum coccineum]